MPPDIMTTRDYFAAAALTGLLAARAGDGILSADLVKMAIRYADAMVAATLQPAKPHAAAAGVSGTSRVRSVQPGASCGAARVAEKFGKRHDDVLRKIRGLDI